MTILSKARVGRDAVGGCFDDVRNYALVLVASALALGAGCNTAHSAEPTTVNAATAPVNGTPAPLAAAGPDVAALVAKVKPSVVNITVQQKGHMVREQDDQDERGGSPFDFFFRGPDGQPGDSRPQRALGSGFIIDAQGHVVTNAHVVDGADTVKVKLADERELKAKVLGRDKRLDLAVLQIEGAKDLPYAALGSSDKLQVGEYVVAIGNPFGLGHTVTMGIVSAKGRAIGAGPYDDFIQTDASINPGNSGGPLFDARGQVIGINTAINPAGQGIGFAIPADGLRDVLPQLIATGHVERGRLGVVIQSVDSELASALKLSGTRGALVGDVERGGPGDGAGLQKGDVIVAVDGTEVPRANDLPRMVARHKPGSTVSLDVLRSGSKRVVFVQLAALEEESTAKAKPGAEPSKSGELGIQLQNAEGGGALVRRVVPGSPAEGKLLPGDTIVEVDHQKIDRVEDLAAKVRTAPAEKPMLLVVKREGNSRFVAIEKK